ncbi:Xaa-Pro dipeptidyl-peptidase [Lactococcus termiticola]|uniref:Xaa-Pro dipeptidyl-peptidase n=1 Tax=Lactococcus termiticola TaxID=2169526 RepID=A0A2R5HF80_9LACT|nr:Xaa-Pro dipeptidyl-peptidase [Lactococcus termiticola]GBG96486.1 Xaa-Pro dipeptidyl-peptidase [Lactococcus termiticola]
MVTFNHFSIVEKSMDEKLAELDHLGFHWSVFWEPKKILRDFLITSPVDMTKLLASPSLALTDFLKLDVALDWEIYWAISLQLLGFTANFEYDLSHAVDFAKKSKLPMLDDELELTSEVLIEGLYLLLASRRKNGMTLVEQWVSEGLIPVDNQFHFFNDKSLATFDTSKLKREILWVESNVDSWGRGQKDLIKLQIIRPSFDGGKLPVVMTASPYHLGINGWANDKQLHDMKVDLNEKAQGSLHVNPEAIPSQEYGQQAEAETASEASYDFTHGWTYSLNDYLLARGFASVYVAGIGTRDSDGFQTSGDYQQVLSMTAAIDWLNGRTKAYTSKRRDHEVKADWANGKVAMTGRSYLGTMAYGAATTAVDGLEVILAEAGISSWYGYYRENGLVRSPGGYPGEDLDVLAELTYSKNLDGADFLENNEAYQEKLKEMTISLDRAYGDYNQFWEARNYLPHADEVKADVLIIHGLQDWNVTPDQAYNFWHALPEGHRKHLILHRGEHVYINSWQSIDLSELVNSYFSAKLLDRALSLELPPVILQENGRAQSWSARSEWGSSEILQIPLAKTAVSIEKFENHYDEADFERYSKDFKVFKEELFTGKISQQTSVIDLDILDEVEINGRVELQLKVKVSDSKALLSAQILDFGNKKRLPDRAKAIDIKALDRGRNFAQEDLLELPLVDSPYQLVSKAFLNLQNREGLMEHKAVRPDEWMEFRLSMQPNIYRLEKGDKLRILLYSTDFEHTIRDNREVSYEIDLGRSHLIVPYSDGE